MSALLVLMFAGAMHSAAQTPLDRGSPRLPPRDALQGTRPTQALLPPKPATVFVNFDGAVLNGEREDARSNSTLIGFEGEFEAYGDGAKRMAVLQAVREDWEPFAVTVTDERPASGDYTMAMVGPTNFIGSLGIALLDCGNDWTANNVVYAFHAIEDGFTASSTATTIGQEIGHAFGLEHVDEQRDIMHPSNKGGDSRFLDACHNVLPADGIGIACTEQHIEVCGSSSKQNSYGELMRLVGPRPVDSNPPSIAFAAPMPEAEFELDETFVLEVDARDDHGITMVELVHDGEVVAFDDSPPYSWEVRDAPVGEYRFTAVAYDASGNRSHTEELTVFVDPIEGDTDSDGWDETGEPSFGSTGDDDDGRGVQPLDPADLARESGPKQSCAVSGSAPPSGGIMLLSILGLLRARRRSKHAA